MQFEQQLKIVIATIGKTETAKQIGFRPETMTRKIKNLDLWRLNEIRKIEKLYNELAELPLK